MKPGRILLSILLAALLSSPALPGSKRYVFHFVPQPSPVTFISGNRVILSSNGLTIVLKQVPRPPFADRFEIFQADPDVFFFYFEITIRNRSGKDVEINPIFFSAITDRREFRKPLNYDELYMLLSKLYDPNAFGPILMRHLVDFFSPIRNGEERTGILIFRNFREKSSECIIKLDAISIGGEPHGFAFPYRLERRSVVVDER